jgi:hypothetical protein
MERLYSRLGSLVLRWNRWRERTQSILRLNLTLCRKHSAVTEDDRSNKTRVDEVGVGSGGIQPAWSAGSMLIFRAD